MLVSLSDGGVKVVSYILECHYGAVTCMILLFIFMKTNKIFEPHVRHAFYCVIMTIIALCLTDSATIYFLSVGHPTFGLICSMVIGYAFRPLVALFSYYIVRRKSGHNYWLWIVEAVNVIIVMTAFFSPIAFSYSLTNQFIRGPLGFSPHIASLFYIIMIFMSALRMYREKDFSEVLLLVALAAIVITAVILDMMFRCWLTITSAAVVLSYYYLYFHSQAQMHDQLTGVYNRKAFYMDAVRFRRDICGLVGFDLNDLKLINDTQGHAAGDDALITMTSVIRSHLIRGCRLYRTGGDEFVVLCRRVSQERLDRFINDVKSEMTSTSYRCAAGLAFCEDNADIDILYKKADEAMYKDKTMMKAGRNYRERVREQE